MAKRATPSTASDDQMRALLECYHCPTPFHAVRARFLGNIASPDMQGSPIRMVEAPRRALAAYGRACAKPLGREAKGLRRRAANSRNGLRRRSKCLKVASHRTLD
jgi:hypothetical protein